MKEMRASRKGEDLVCFRCGHRWIQPEEEPPGVCPPARARTGVSLRRGMQSEFHHEHADETRQNLGPINFFIVPIIHAEHSTDYNRDNRAHARSKV
jgi:hypothetical protein